MSKAVAPLTPMGCLRWHIVDSILAKLRPTTVLEMGCGQGAAGTRLAGAARYLGVEPDAASYRVAAQRIEPLGGTVIHGDDTSVPEGRTFDLVCAFEVVEHIEDDKGAVEQWMRFVRPGGHMLLSVPAWQDRFGPMDTLVGHYRRYSPEAMADLLASAGLIESRVTLYGWPLGHALEFGRNRIAARRAGAVTTTPIEDATAGSGRLFQPGRMVGATVRAGTVPFRYLQCLAPRSGTGLVAVATRAG